MYSLIFFSLHNGLDAHHQGQPKDPPSSMIVQEKLILINMIVKTMELILIIPGINPHHYALNVPLYTAGTCPWLVGVVWLGG